MKHYTQFLPKKTLRMVQMGKQINALNFDILETESKLNRLKKERDQLEKEVFENVNLFHGSDSYGVVLQAKEKEYHYNNTRLMKSV